MNIDWLICLIKGHKFLAIDRFETPFYTVMICSRCYGRKYLLQPCKICGEKIRKKEQEKHYLAHILKGELPK